MTSLESSDSAVFQRSISAETTAAAKRPWYAWLCAASAALVGLYYLYFLTLTPLTNLFAFAWLAAVVLACLGGSLGFALNRAWGAKILLVAFLLILPRTAYNAYTVYTIVSSGYTSGFAIRLLGSLIITVAGLYTAVLTTVTLAAMWRSSERLAWATFVLLSMPLLLALAIIPPAFLKP